MDITHLVNSLHSEQSYVKIRKIAQNIPIHETERHEVLITVDEKILSVRLNAEAIKVHINYAEWTNWYFTDCRAKAAFRSCCLLLIEGIVPGATKLEISIGDATDAHDDPKSNAAVSNRGETIATKI